MTPAWILYVFAAIMLVVAGISTCRLFITRSWSGQARDADIDVAHVLMGIAMAGMLASGLRTLPNDVWVAVFAIVTAWFAWRVAAEARSPSGSSALATGHHVPHFIHGAAMIYMFAAISAGGPAGSSGMSGMGGMSGSMGTLKLPTIGFVFVLLMVGWAVFDLDQLTGYLSRTGGDRRVAGVSLPAGLRQRVALAAAGTGSPALAAGVVTAGSGGPDLVSATSASSAELTPAAQVSDVATPSDEAVGKLLLDPRVTIGCRIAMSVTMALMLVLMI
jgi:Domain of unknown function (DUF5134)